MLTAIQQSEALESALYQPLKNPIGVQGVVTNGVERRVFDLVADGNCPVRPQLDQLIPEQFGPGWTVELGNWWTTGYEI